MIHMSSVWDPSIEFSFKQTEAQANDAEWVSDIHSLPPDEVIEVWRAELIGPVTAAGIIKKLKYLTLMIDGKEYEPIRLNHLMSPAQHMTNVGVAVNFGLPYLWRPIIGRLPTPMEGTCPKAKKGQTLGIKTIAGEDILATENYQIILKAARVRSEEKLAEIIGQPTIPLTFRLNADEYPKAEHMVSLDTFDELPGGLAQAKPQIFPWYIWTTNKVASSLNTWYDFDYAAKYVDYKWQEVAWNLVNKDVAYLIKKLGVIPHTNSSKLRLYVEGRITNPEYLTRPLPERNAFYPPQFDDTAVNAGLKRAGPVDIVPPVLFHGVKGGPQIVDIGTAAIAAKGETVEIWGVKFVLK